MKPQRTRLVVNVGNLMELVAAALACWGVGRLVGVDWALILAAVLLVAGAELIFDAHTWRVPVPRRPHPVVRARVARMRLAVRRRRARAAWQDWRLTRAAR